MALKELLVSSKKVYNCRHRDWINTPKNVSAGNFSVAINLSFSSFDIGQVKEVAQA
jgi:hypothetical protein